MKNTKYTQSIKEALSNRDLTLIQFSHDLHHSLSLSMMYFEDFEKEYEGRMYKFGNLQTDYLVLFATEDDLPESLEYM